MRAQPLGPWCGPCADQQGMAQQLTGGVACVFQSAQAGFLFHQAQVDVLAPFYHRCACGMVGLLGLDIKPSRPCISPSPTHPRALSLQARQSADLADHVTKPAAQAGGSGSPGAKRTRAEATALDRELAAAEREAKKAEREAEKERARADKEAARLAREAAAAAKKVVDIAGGGYRVM